MVQVVRNVTSTMRTHGKLQDLVRNIGVRVSINYHNRVSSYASIRTVIGMHRIGSIARICDARILHHNRRRRLVVDIRRSKNIKQLLLELKAWGRCKHLLA